MFQKGFQTKQAQKSLHKFLHYYVKQDPDQNQIQLKQDKKLNVKQQQQQQQYFYCGSVQFLKDPQNQYFLEKIVPSLEYLQNGEFNQFTKLDALKIVLLLNFADKSYLEQKKQIELVEISYLDRKKLNKSKMQEFQHRKSLQPNKNGKIQQEEEEKIVSFKNYQEIGQENQQNYYVMLEDEYEEENDKQQYVESTVKQEIFHKLIEFLKLSKMPKRFEIEELHEILGYMVNNENFLETVKQSVLKRQIGQTVQILLQKLNEHEDIQIISEILGFLQELNPSSFPYNKFLGNFLITYIEKSDEEFDLALAKKTLSQLKNDQPVSKQLLEYIEEFLEDMTYEERLKFIQLNINNSYFFNTETQDKIIQKNLDIFNNLSKNFKDVSEFCRNFHYSFTVLLQYMTLQSLEIQQKFYGISQNHILYLIKNYENLQDEQSFTLINSIYMLIEQVSISQNQSVQVQGTEFGQEIVQFLQKTYINNLNQETILPIDNIGVLELMYIYLKLKPYDTKTIDLFKYYIVEEIQFNEEANDVSMADQNSENFSVFLKSFKKLIIDKDVLFKLHQVFQELQMQEFSFENHSFRDLVFQRKMQFFFQQTGLIWSIPTIGKQSIFENQVNDLTSYVQTISVFNNYQKKGQIGEKYMRRFLESKSFFTYEGYKIYDFQKINFLLQSNQSLHIQLLEKQAKFLLTQEISASMSLQGMLNILNQFLNFKLTFRQFFNSEKNKGYLQGYYEIFYLIEDTIFRKAVTNYDELKKTEKMDIFETFKKQDLQKTKEDWRNFKEKLDLNQDLQINDVEILFQMFFSIAKFNMTTNRYNWIVTRLLGIYFNKISKPLKCEMLYYIGELDLGSENLEVKVENYLEKQKYNFSLQESVQILWFFAVKFNQNQEALEGLIQNIQKYDKNQIKQELNTDQQHRLFIVYNLYQLEQKKLKWKLNQEVEDFLEESFQSFNFFSRQTSFSDFIKSFFNNFGFPQYKMNQQVGIFNFLITFPDSNVCVILDKECYRGRTKEEIGLIAIIRRYLVKNKFRMRIFEFYEFNQFTRRHQKHNYLKLKMSKIEQDPEFLKQKYHYNY